MAIPPGSTTRLEIRPLTTENWSDLVELFGPSGAYGGCWCMWWRLTRAEFEHNKGAGNRRALERLVKAGEVPGLLGYLDGAPVAWCSVAQRAAFATLGRSRVLKPLDERPVWSIVCLFIAREHRGSGLTTPLIRGAVEYVRAQGGTVVEGYPTVPRERRLPPVSSFMGVPAVFERAGFEEVARPSPARMIVRRQL